MQKYSRSQIINLIKRIEHKYPVDTWQIGELCIWPMVRFSIYAKLWSSTNSIQQATPKFYQYKKLIEEVIKHQIENDSVKSTGRYKAVFLNNSGCRRKVNDRWVDVFCDPLIADLKKQKNIDSLVMEWDNTEYRSPCNNESIHIQKYIDRIKIKSKVESYLKKIELPFFEEINSEVNNVLDLRELSYQCKLVNNLYNFFLDKLSSIRPLFAFTTIYYNEISIAFMLACKDIGAITIDIQHGMQVGNNPAYTGGETLPDNAYRMLPDVFLVRGIAEKQNIEKWLRHGRVVISGDLWLKLWKKNDEKYVCYYDELIDNLIKREKKTILYTLDYSPIPKLMLDVIRSTQEDFLWCVRLHPADLENIDYRKHELLGLSNIIDLNKGSVWPLQAWLRKVDIHITEFSGVVLEAEQFGVPSIIISPQESHLFSETIQRGNAGVADGVQEIVSLLKKFNRKPMCGDNEFDYLQELLND